MRLHSAIVVAALLLSFSQAAIAQSTAPNAAAAEALYIEAEALIKAESFARACAKFGESQRLDPQLGTLLHLADCYERNGQTASAWVTFREAVELAARKGDSRERVAKERAEALASKLSTFTLVVPRESEVDGLEVEQEGQPLRSAMWGVAVPTDPGTYRVAARATNREPWTYVVRVTEADKIVVTLPLLAPRPVQKPVPATGSPESAEGPPPPSIGSGEHLPLRTLGWVVAGTGALGLVGGAAFAAVASSKGNDANNICPSGKGCSRDEVNRYNDAYSGAESAATTSRIALGIGGTLLVVGFVMVLVAPTSRQASTTPPARQLAGRSSAGWGLAW